MKNAKLFNKNKKSFLEKKEEDKDGFVDYFENINFSDKEFVTESLRWDWVTAFQDKIAFTILMKLRESVLNTSISKDDAFILDVGSKFSSVVHFSNILKTFFLECRNEIPANTICEIPGMSLGIINAEAQKIGFNDGSVPIITCLHAMEHFGLGRYGDTVDYFGDQKGLKEFHRLLHEKGYLLLSVPFAIDDTPRIEYHSQRVYDYKTVDLMLEKQGFEKMANWFIFPLGGIRDEEGELLSPIIVNTDYVDALVPSPTAANEFGVYMTLSKKIEE